MDLNIQLNIQDYYQQGPRITYITRIKFVEMKTKEQKGKHKNTCRKIRMKETNEHETFVDLKQASPTLPVLCDPVK